MPSRKVMIIIEYIKKYHYIKLVVIKNQIVVIEKKRKFELDLSNYATKSVVTQQQDTSEILIHQNLLERSIYLVQSLKQINQTLIN